MDRGLHYRRCLLGYTSCMNTFFQPNLLYIPKKDSQRDVLCRMRGKVPQQAVAKISRQKSRRHEDTRDL